MVLPMVCCVTWNRAGLTKRNLTALLDSTDDFELYIIDNNSQDDTWKFIESLNDDRIKEKKRFDINRGVTYAINYVLSKRKKEQYFILVENDVYVKTKDFVGQFMKLMGAFPEFGLLSAAFWLIEQKVFIPEIIKKGDLTVYQHDIVYMPCCCIRPELFDYFGYWNEETYLGDLDFWKRVTYTPLKLAYIDTIQIEQTQIISCDQCLLKEECSLLDKSVTCFDIWKSKHRHLPFARSEQTAIQAKAYWEEVNSGKRSIYCASIHDPDSMNNHVYCKEWAETNFKYYIDNAN